MHRLIWFFKRFGCPNWFWQERCHKKAGQVEPFLSLEYALVQKGPLFVCILTFTTSILQVLYVYEISLSSYFSSSWQLQKMPIEMCKAKYTRSPWHQIILYVAIKYFLYKKNVNFIHFWQEIQYCNKPLYPYGHFFWKYNCTVQMMWIRLNSYEYSK